MADRSNDPKHPFRHGELREPAQNSTYDPLRAFAERRTNIGLTRDGIKAKRSKRPRWLFFAGWMVLSVVVTFFILLWLSFATLLTWPLIGSMLAAVMALVYALEHLLEREHVSRLLHDAPSPSEALRRDSMARLDHLRAKLVPPRRVAPVYQDATERATAAARYWQGHVRQAPPLEYDTAAGDDQRSRAFDHVVRVCDRLDREIVELELLSAEASLADRRSAWPQLDAYITELKEACGQLPVLEIPVLSRVRVDPGVATEGAIAVEPARSAGVLAKLRTGRG